MTIDERIEALTMNLELVSHEIKDLSHEIDKLRLMGQQDGENIRAPSSSVCAPRASP